MNVDELLKQRYGQARFNPAAGQTQMTFQEWMDRHPSLQGRGGDKNFAMYQGFNNAANGAAYSGPQNVTAPDYSEQLADANRRFAASGGWGRAATPPANPAADPMGTPDSPTRPDVVGSMGAPDAPPSAAASRPNVGQGMDYKTFLSKRGVNARMSTAANAAAWRRTQAKKPSQKKGGTNNTQQAH